MLALGPQTPVFIAVSPVDFRLGIDGLARRCHSVLFQRPMSGAVFVFRNRRRTAVKLIHYDGQGFVLLHKRWSAGRLNWWPESAHESLQVPVRDLQVLLYNGDPQGARMAADWRSLKPLLDEPPSPSSNPSP